MSSGLHHNTESKIDVYWPIGLIAFGIACVLFVACWTIRW